VVIRRLVTFVGHVSVLLFTYWLIDLFSHWLCVADFG